MRKTLLIYTLLIFSSVYNVGAQVRNSNDKVVIDTCLLEVIYKLQYYKDTITRKPFYDNQIIEIGLNYSHFYSLFADDMDSVMYKSRYKNNLSEEGVAIRQNLKDNEDGSYEDIFLNYPQKSKMLVSNYIIKYEYRHLEDIPIIKWNLTAQQDTILGYVCQKATTTFRGRQWNVWFALEIPLPFGPWKLHGLPGLILKAQDSNKLFTYNAINIQNGLGMIYIHSNKNLIQNVDKAKVVKLLELKWKDPTSLNAMFGIKSFSMTINRNGQVSKPNELKVGEVRNPYIPQIELE